MPLPPALLNELQTAVAQIDSHRNRLIQDATTIKVRVVVGMGIVWWIGILVALAVLLEGARFYGILMSCYMLLPIGFFIGFLFEKRRTGRGQITKDQHLFYARAWVQTVLTAFLEKRYGSHVHTTYSPSFAPEIRQRIIFNPFINAETLPEYRAGIRYNQAGVCVEIDVLEFRDNAICTFKGIVFKVPFLQLFPKSITWIISPNHQTANPVPDAKNMKPVLHPESRGFKHFNILSNNTLAAEEIIFSGWTDAIENTPFLRRNPFVLTVSEHTAFFWLELGYDICFPELDQATHNTIDIDLWDNIMDVAKLFLQIAASRQDNQTPNG